MSARFLINLRYVFLINIRFPDQLKIRVFFFLTIINKYGLLSIYNKDLVGDFVNLLL